MPRALLLDAAGTLIETSEPVADSYARILARHGHKIRAAQLAPAFRAAFGQAGEPDYAGHPDGESAERAWWHGVVTRCVGGSITDAAFEDLFDHFANPAAWRVFPEVRDELQRFRVLGLRLVVVSNFDARLHPILEGLGLAPCFEAILTSSAARARKPSPAIFRHALVRLGLPAGQVVHVGDSPRADIEGARAAGIEAFLLQRPHTTLSHCHDWLAGRPG